MTTDNRADDDGKVMDSLMDGMNRLVRENKKFTPECGQALSQMADVYAKLYRARFKITI